MLLESCVMEFIVKSIKLLVDSNVRYFKKIKSFVETKLLSYCEIIKQMILFKKYSDQLSTTALVRRNATKNLENSCFILNQLY